MGLARRNFQTHLQRAVQIVRDRLIYVKLPSQVKARFPKRCSACEREPGERPPILQNLTQTDVAHSLLLINCLQSAYLYYILVVILYSSHSNQPLFK